MSNLIVKSDNIFSKFLNWFKNKFFNKNKYNNNVEKIEKKDSSNLNNNNKQNQNIDDKSVRKYVYKQDLSFETEKQNTIKTTKDVLNGEKELEDLDLADMVRIKLMLEN